jgi:transcriptional regulator GlxA family with amidase domain
MHRGPPAFPKLETPGNSASVFAMLQDSSKVPRPPETLVFLLAPDLSMMSLASAIEPLRALNRLAGFDAYQWRLASPDGRRISCSNGILLDTEPLDVALTNASRLFICAGLRTSDAIAKPYLSALRKAARIGVPIGSISIGTYFLARSGLLKGRRCTVHWEVRPAFLEEFPEIDCTNRLYEIDGTCMTCSGGTAAMDMMLHMIGATHGFELMNAVANQFHHERIRTIAEDQRGGAIGFMAQLPSQVQQAVALMKQNIEHPLPLAELSALAGVTPRQLERLMLKHLKAKPHRLYLLFRLERARELLIYSNASITDVSMQAGFSSTSHFAATYRRFFSVRPSDVRNGAPVNPGQAFPSSS